MATEEAVFHEARLGETPIRELGLAIAGSALEPILAEFQAEVKQAGITRLRPHFYLSTEWGVPFGTTAIAIPFYLARPDLTRLHAERHGYVEGSGRADILHYLRHEMGHVVNYAYRLYEEEEWVKHFGPSTRPYLEEYQPQPFSRQFVRHLPGWYAQKHPDEDWSETFAVWMTPGLDWRCEYAGWTVALTKLEYCDRVLAQVRQRDPYPVAEVLDEDVSELVCSLDQFYGNLELTAAELPPGLDGALRALFEDEGHPESISGAARKPVSGLIRRLERDLVANLFRWTGHLPERARALLHHLARRADALQQVYPADQELRATVALTTLVTALAMNYTTRADYLP